MPIDKKKLKDIFQHRNNISFDEFCRIMQDFGPHSPDAYFQETFRAFDKNSDGFITAKEIKKTMKELGERLTDKQAKDMLKTADSNGDGKLSKDEFRILFNYLTQFTTSLPVSPSSSMTINEHNSQSIHSLQQQ
jgi:Ca2+-binding EF-hand superfamily protein